MENMAPSLLCDHLLNCLLYTSPSPRDASYYLVCRLLLENKILHSWSKNPRLCHEWQFFNFQHYSQIMETKSQLVFIEITIYRSARHCVFHAYYQSHFCSFRNVDVKSFDIISLIHQVPLELSASDHLFLLLFVLMSLVAGTIYINLCLWGQKIIFAELLISFKG